MMNTLAQVLMKDAFTKGSFAGVYACDLLSFYQNKQVSHSFMVNTDPMEVPGTHWIAIRQTNERRIL